MAISVISTSSVNQAITSSNAVIQELILQENSVVAQQAEELKALEVWLNIEHLQVLQIFMQLQEA